MEFRHSDQIWRDHPSLAVGVLLADGIGGEATADRLQARADVAQRVAEAVAEHTDVARSRLSTTTEADLPEIQAWRRTFAGMGLKPTGYRCASEALLRRLRKSGELPSINPMIDLCNAVSAAYAIPIAALDVAEITDGIEVGYATGEEKYLTFSGEIEHPDPGEVIFADRAGHAHARRWTNRQSGKSAVRDSTSTVLIVAEALHESATADIRRLTETLVEQVQRIWSVATKHALLSATGPAFTW